MILQLLQIEKHSFEQTVVLFKYPNNRRMFLPLSTHIKTLDPVSGNPEDFNLTDS